MRINKKGGTPVSEQEGWVGGTPVKINTKGDTPVRVNKKGGCASQTTSDSEQEWVLQVCGTPVTLDWKGYYRCVVHQ